MHDQIELGADPIEIYAATGEASGSEIRIQNLSVNHSIQVWTGSALPPPANQAWVLGPLQSEIFSGVVIAVWTKNKGQWGQIQTELSA